MRMSSACRTAGSTSRAHEVPKGRCCRMDEGRQGLATLDVHSTTRAPHHPYAMHLPVSLEGHHFSGEQVESNCCPLLCTPPSCRFLTARALPWRQAGRASHHPSTNALHQCPHAKMALTGRVSSWRRAGRASYCPAPAATARACTHNRGMVRQSNGSPQQSSRWRKC